MLTKCQVSSMTQKEALVSLKNRKARVAFAREHLTWSTVDWTKVVFSDELKFNRFGSDGNKYMPKSYVRSQKLDRNWIFIQDNDPKSSRNFTKYWLHRKKINKMEW
uniref:Transposase n=1 Tax=Heterorhabditis bacteriophora TaxID=37862 RepID=A0A1I7WA10_HETBA